MTILRTCENCRGNYVCLSVWVSKIGFQWGVLELACQTTWPMPFKVRAGVLSKTLSHVWGKLNLPILIHLVLL